MLPWAKEQLNVCHNLDFGQSWVYKWGKWIDGADCDDGTRGQMESEEEYNKGIISLLAWHQNSGIDTCTTSWGWILRGKV